MFRFHPVTAVLVALAIIAAPEAAQAQYRYCGGSYRTNYCSSGESGGRIAETVAVLGGVLVVRHFEHQHQERVLDRVLTHREQMPGIEAGAVGHVVDRQANAAIAVERARSENRIAENRSFTDDRVHEHNATRPQVVLVNAGAAAPAPRSESNSGSGRKLSEEELEKIRAETGYKPKSPPAQAAPTQEPKPEPTIGKETIERIGALKYQAAQYERRIDELRAETPKTVEGYRERDSLVLELEARCLEFYDEIARLEKP